MSTYYSRDGVTIHLGDCLEAMGLFAAGSVGAVVTDPPYSSGGAFRSDRTQSTVAKYVHSGVKAYRPEFGGDSRDQRGYLAWSSMWMGLARRASGPGSVLCAFTDWRQMPVTTDAVQAAGWTWRNVATWHKPGVRTQKGRFSASAEYVVYASNGPLGPLGGPGKGCPANVFAHKIDRTREHVAQKPVAVMSWILGVVPVGAVVLDPFAGSGSTLVAALGQGHPAIGIEADEMYAEIAARRIDAAIDARGAGG